MTVVKHCWIKIPLTIKAETDHAANSLALLAATDAARIFHRNKFWRDHLTYVGETEIEAREPS